MVRTWTLSGVTWLTPDNGMHLSQRSVNEEGVLGDGGGDEGPEEATAMESQSCHI